MEPVEISAGRLHLRPWGPSDVEAVLRAGSECPRNRLHSSGVSPP